MASRAAHHVFGPVPSRRLQRSLGINNLAGKQCSYSCVYCQAGRTRSLSLARETFANPRDLFDEVRAALDATRANGAAVDFVSFVPAGEPTLDLNLGRAISAIKGLGVRVAVFTNGSLLWREDVRDELSLADWVSVKVDAATETVWRRMNRPLPSLSFDAVIEGVRAFARRHAGTFVTETTLVAGLNDHAYELDALGGELAALAPATAWLGVPVRPPAESWVTAPRAPDYDRALEIFKRRLPSVRPLLAEAAAQWQAVSVSREGLLAMAAVHPLRHSELESLLRMSRGTWETVTGLLREGQLEPVAFGGERFYRLAEQPVRPARKPARAGRRSGR